MGLGWASTFQVNGSVSQRENMNDQYINSILFFFLKEKEDKNIEKKVLRNNFKMDEQEV